MKPEGRDILFIVDDDLAVRQSLKFSLELEGFEVMTCGSGDELLRHPALAEARCLLIDYKMPEMDGIELLERLAQANVRVPVILVTSHVSRLVSQRARAAGVRHMIEKPLLDGQLYDTIQSVIGAGSLSAT